MGGSPMVCDQMQIGAMKCSRPSWTEAYVRIGTRPLTDCTCGAGSASGDALDRELDQPVEQIRIRQAARFPELRIHADGGESGDRVQFVEVDAAVRLAIRKSARAIPAQSIAR